MTDPLRDLFDVNTWKHGLVPVEELCDGEPLDSAGKPIDTGNNGLDTDMFNPIES